MMISTFWILNLNRSAGLTWSTFSCFIDSNDAEIILSVLYQVWHIEDIGGIGMLEIVFL